MKKIFAIALSLLFALTAQAQWLESKVYDKPLKEVLTQIEQRYGVTLIYEEKNVKGRVVEKAAWRMMDDVETTLDNVLHPLDMRFSKRNEKSYDIKKWEYFRKPYEQGQLHLDRLLDSFPNQATLAQRKTLMRTHMLHIQGLDSLPKCDLNPIRSNKRTHNKYSVENIALEILPKVWVCGSLYMPSSFNGQIPLFLSPHGHFYNSVDNSIPNDRGRYRADQQYRCAMLAQMGVAVFSYDMFGWGESAFNTKDHRTELGLKMQTWQSIRVLDFLCSQPWADTKRVGATGASGGGTQVMIIAALDNRITLSVPTVMASSHFFGGCPCESGIPIHFPKASIPSNNAELCAMFAPKPQLLISDGNDWTVTVPKIEFPYLQKVYGIYGKRNMVDNVHLATEKHDYGFSKRMAMYEFVVHHFNLDLKNIHKKNGVYDESNITIEPAEAMYVFSGELPSGALKGASNLRKLLKDYRINTKN